MNRGEPEDLLERVARGERAALLALYDRVSATLMAVALRVTGTRSEAEEVVQDAFMRAWREAPSFDRARGSALAWLITLTRNRSIDVVRSRRRRALHEDEAAGAEPPEVAPGPELALVDSERAAAVRLALETLRPEQRAVLELAYFSGLSHSEIAARLSQPLGTVKTRILQAVRHLRERLGRHAPEGGRD
jgi:RNA polymerase sigma-70 factor (ECF subfamily)